MHAFKSVFSPYFFSADLTDGDHEVCDAADLHLIPDHDESVRCGGLKDLPAERDLTIDATVASDPASVPLFHDRLHG